MTRYAAVAVALLAFSFDSPAVGQSCYTPITSFQADYTMTGTGAGKDRFGFYSWTINHQMKASPDMPNAGASCTGMVFGGVDATGSGTADDHGTAKCVDNTPNNVDITGGVNILSAATLTIDTSGGTYQFTPAVDVLATSTDNNCGTIQTSPIDVALDPKNQACTGEAATPKFTLPQTVQPLIQSGAHFGGNANCLFGGIPSDFVLGFQLIPTYKDDKDCKKKGGSSVGCRNQSLGEDLTIVGTGFSLHYEGSRAAVAGGETVASNDTLMIGGWTLSVHHAFNPASQTLFLGDGSQRNGYQLGTPVSYLGNILITSEEGDEIYVFSPAGQHLQTVRPLTGALLYQFGYNSKGNLVTVTDGNGNVTTIRRNTAGHATAIVSPYAQTTTLTLDSNFFLSQVKDPLGKVASFTNTAEGLITSRTDANGNTYNYTYDNASKLIKDADPVGGYRAMTRTNATSGLGWTVGHSTAMGQSSSYQSQVTLPWVQDGSSPFTNQQTTIGPDGLQVTSTETQQGQQRSEALTLPDGSSSSETFGPDPIWGLQMPVTTSSTVTQGSLTMTTSASRSTTLGTAGNPFSVASKTDIQAANGRTYTSTFTGSTRTNVDQSPMGRTVTTVLDPQERVAGRQVTGLTALALSYTTKGRLAAVVQGTRRTSFTYNSKGFISAVSDPLTLKTSFAYDADGRLLNTTLPDARVVSYTHDGNGNLLSLTPPGKSAHTFTYTAVDLPASYTPPNGAAATTFAYDLDRNLTSVERPGGQTINYTYDTAGRLTKVATPSASSSYTYSATTGNLATAGRGSEHLTYSYNGPLLAKSTWTGTVAGTVSRTYDKNFWVASQTVGGGSTVSYRHDTDGLVTGAGSLTVRRSLQHGLITGTTLGVATDTRAYNGFGEPTSYTASINGAVAYKNQLTRNADGMITARTETIGGVTSTYSYSYDLARRLTAAAKNSSVDTYTYDTNSNRLSETAPSGTSSATYDAEDRLLTYGNASYTYTASGNTLSQKIGTQTTTYAYDALGNLTAATLPNGTKIAYVIDAKNRRVGKTVNGVLVNGFLYDKTRIVAQLNGSNQLVSQFVYATGSASPDYMISSSATYRIFSDLLGSPVLVVDTATGAIAEQISYDEFGNVLSDTNPGFQPFGFAGGLYDQDTKLVRFGARDYNPLIGRWTAKDPVLFSGGDSNLYGYVSNDPVNSSDPSGLGPSDWRWVKWIMKRFEKKKCEKCEVSPDKPDKEPEGDGLTKKDLAVHTAVHVGAEAGAEAAGEAIGSETIGKAGGPAVTVVVGATVAAEGFFEVVKIRKQYDDIQTKVDCGSQ